MSLSRIDRPGEARNIDIHVNSRPVVNEMSITVLGASCRRFRCIVFRARNPMTAPNGRKKSIPDSNFSHENKLFSVHERLGHRKE